MSAQQLITEHIDLWTSTIKARKTQGRGSSKKRELYGIKKLRELILELAFSGKLCAQNNSNLNFDDLLEKMRVEKEKYHQKKGVRLQKFKLIADHQIEVSHPISWRSFYYDEVISYITDFQANGSFASLKRNVTYFDSPNYALLVRLTDLRHGLSDGASYKYTDKAGYQFLKKSSINGGELVVANVGAGVGTTLQIPEVKMPSTLAPNMFMVVLSSFINKEYFLHYSQSPQYKKYISLVNAGTGQPKINKTEYKNCKIPFPPTEEQERIVDKINELMALCDQLEQQTESSLNAHNLLVDTLLSTLTNARDAKELSDSWARFMATDDLTAGNAGAMSSNQSVFDTLITTDYAVEQLKQTILQLAVMGKLVPQDPNDEPASELLKRIAAEKAQLIKDKKIKKQKPLSDITKEEKLFGLPNGWEWTQLGQISEIAPRNSLDDDLEVGFVPMPMISTSYKGEHKQEVKFWSAIKKGYTHFANGDIGLAKITPCFENSKAAVFKDLKNGYGAGTTELHIARPIAGTIDTLFVLLYLKAPMFLEKGKPKMTGSAGQKRIPNDFFSGNPLPFPPLTEQHRIVAKVDKLMALCDQLKAQLNNAQTTQLHLTDAVVENVLTA